MSVNTASGHEIPVEIVQGHRTFENFIATLPPHHHRISMSLRKLSKFSEAHLIELSLDIADEIDRRKDPRYSKGEHLPARRDIHPKRNHARYQLGTLSDMRLGGMCKDLIAEQERRFPGLLDLAEQEQADQSRDSQPRGAPQTVYTTEVLPTKATMNFEDSGDSSDDYEDYEGDSVASLNSPSNPPTAQAIDQESALQKKLQEKYEQPLHENPSVNEFKFDTEEQLRSLDSPKMPEDVDQDLSFDRTEEILPTKSLDSPKTATDTEESKRLAAELQAKNQQVEKLEIEIKDKDGQIHDLVEECSRLDKSVTELEGQVRELESFKTQATTENDQLHDMLQDATRDYKQAAATHADEIKRHTDEIASLRAAQAAPTTLATAHAGDGQSGQATRSLAGQSSAAPAGHTGSTTSLDIRNSSVVAGPSGKPSYEELERQLEQQQRVTDQVRHEASLFLQEMRELTQRRTQNSDSQSAQTQTLRLEIQEWKSRHLRAMDELRALRSGVDSRSSHSMLRPPPEPEQFYDANGKIRDSSVKEFQAAVDTLLVNARGQPEALLDNLHGVVLATRRVTQDIDENDSKYSTYTRLISRTANQLISVVRNMSVAGGLLPFALLDAACSDLSFSVVELFKAARIYRDQPAQSGPARLSQGHESRGLPLQNSANALNRRDSRGSRGSRDSLDHVRDSHEKHLSRVSENYTQSPEQKPHMHGGDRYSTDTFSIPGSVPGSVPGSIPGSVPSAPYSAPHSAGTIGTGTSGTTFTSSAESRPEEPRKTVPSMSERSESDRSLNAPHRTVLPPDSTIAELQGYLEEQTSETVDSIQSLLSGIRDNEPAGQLKPKVFQISVLVDKMLGATGSSMAQTRNWLLKDKGSFILQNLSDCSARMGTLYEDLGRLDDHAPAHRQLKQRLAGVSFDMAKSTKELVKTVEEVSLKSELEDIDNRLAGA